MSKVCSSFPSLQLLCLQDPDGLSGAIVLKCSDMVIGPSCMLLMRQQQRMQSGKCVYRSLGLEDTCFRDISVHLAKVRCKV